MAARTSSGATLAPFSFIRVNFFRYVYITRQVLVEIVVSTCSVCVKQVKNNERILMKFGVWNFYEKVLSHFNFYLDWTILINILEKDVHLFAHSHEAWIADYWFKGKMFEGEVVEENEINILFLHFFQKSYRFSDG